MFKITTIRNPGKTQTATCQEQATYLRIQQVVQTSPVGTTVSFRKRALSRTSTSFNKTTRTRGIGKLEKEARWDTVKIYLWTPDKGRCITKWGRTDWLNKMVITFRLHKTWSISKMERVLTPAWIFSRPITLSKLLWIKRLEMHHLVATTERARAQADKDSITAKEEVLKMWTNLRNSKTWIIQIYDEITQWEFLQLTLKAQTMPTHKQDKLGTHLRIKWDSLLLMGLTALSNRIQMDSWCWVIKIIQQVGRKDRTKLISIKFILITCQIKDQVEPFPNKSCHKLDKSSKWTQMVKWE